MALKFGVNDVIDENYIFTFGKYRDELLHDIIFTDPNYVLWCADNINWFDLDSRLYVLAEQLSWESAPDIYDYREDNNS